MRVALDEALNGLRMKEGGPFGAVIVKDGEIIARGHNQVISSHDPTAHAEIVAIRAASRLLQRFDLSDCILYTTCEPCPMCFGAIHWAKIPLVFYGATRTDASEIGFDDNLIYEFLAGRSQDDQLTLKQSNRDECLLAFKEYMLDQSRVHY